MTELGAALRRFAALPRILVATDYDGVVAPIVADPTAAYPLPGTVAALTALSALPGVSVALVSGRDRDTLGRLSGVPASIVTVGSHGAEFEDGFDAGLGDAGLDDAARVRREQVLADLESIARQFEGAAVEAKPLGGALHVRNVTPTAAESAESLADRAIDLARRGPATRAGVHATNGKAVLELAVLEASKGRALTTLRDRTGSAATLYLGDDVTDERAFAVLTAPEDVSVKVGDGDTAARYRVAAPEDVRTVFESVLALRQRSG